MNSIAPPLQLPIHGDASWFISSIVIEFLLQFSDGDPRKLRLSEHPHQEWVRHRESLLHHCREDHSWLINTIDALYEFPETIHEIAIEHVSEIGDANFKLNQTCTETAMKY